MKNRTLLLLAGLAIITCTCKDSSEKQIVQEENFWVILDRSFALESEGKLSWNFTLIRKGSYNVQIISNGEPSSPIPELTLECGGQVLKEAPEQIFVLEGKDGKQTVSHFRNLISFREAGAQVLQIESKAAIQKIRIVPRYGRNLGFGTGKYEEGWTAMHKSPEKQASLAWLKEAKYGMFIHWGLYSQAGGIWKGTRINDSPYPGPSVAEWLMFKFRISREEYATLANTFESDRSFAEEIATLAADAGMKYVVITSKHHDGFALFDSECSDYDVVDASPYGADAIKELYDACLEKGLKFGVYYSHGNDWFDGTDGNHAHVKRLNDSLGVLSHPNGKNLWDPSPNTYQEYLDSKAYPQIEELLHLMPELALIWFDGDGNLTEDQSWKFYKSIYDINPHVLVSRRVGYDFGDYLDAGDNVIPSASDTLAKQWETCGTTNNSWGYKSYDEDWKSTPELLYYLIDIASKGGNYLLNIGPDGKGHIPEASAWGLREVGKWLQVNGEAIYGTSRWKVPSEGQEETLLEGTGHRAQTGFTRSFSNNEFWFTSKNNKAYAISLVPAPDTVQIRSLHSGNGIISSVRLLGTNKAIVWDQTDEELKVDLNGLETGENGYALEVSFK